MLRNTLQSSTRDPWRFGVVNGLIMVSLNDVFILFITARIRRMGEGTVFSLFVSSHLGGGIPQSGLGGVPHPKSGQGVPHPRSGWGEGYPSQVWPGGYPIPGLGRGGGTPSQVWMREGYPPDQVWMGYPQTWDGVPPGPGMGYPPDLGWGTFPGPGMGYLPWTWDGYHPGPEMGYPLEPGMGYTPNLGHSEHLLHGGQYASCIHAGVLSCIGFYVNPYPAKCNYCAFCKLSTLC